MQIELVTGPTNTLIARVHRFEVEAALVPEPFHKAELEMQEAFVEELVLIAPKDAAPAKCVQELSLRTVIAFATGCSYRRILEDWLAVSEVVPERVLELASYHAIVACVAAGSGFAIMPRSVLEEVHTGSQVHVMPLPPGGRDGSDFSDLAWRLPFDRTGCAARGVGLKYFCTTQ